MPAVLRKRLSADYRAVRPLPSPWIRALWMLPLAVFVVLAAPLAFFIRADTPALGWLGSWGASGMQAALGMLVIAAALREAVPGREWRFVSAAVWLLVPVLVIVFVTFATWELSAIPLSTGWWVIGGMCLVGSFVSSLPVVTLAAVLAARAYPLRPWLAGALLGTGAGTIADAGWRIFCHFSEPSHVLSAHLGAVAAAALVGAGLAAIICRARRTAL